MADNFAEGVCVGCGRIGFGYGLCRDCIALEGKKMIEQAARTIDRITAEAILDPSKKDECTCLRICTADQNGVLQPGPIIDIDPRCSVHNGLAAAAPELLAALKGLVSAIERVESECWAGPECSTEYDKARALIARLEGIE